MGFGGSKVEHVTSPQQAQAGRLAGEYGDILLGAMRRGGPLYEIPPMPRAPDLTQVPLPRAYGYPIQGYQTVSPLMGMPSKATWNQFSPEVLGGLRAQYDQPRKQMIETLGRYGQFGSDIAGVSGAGAAALGEFEAQAARDVNLQAAQMMQPALMFGMQAEQARRAGLAGQYTQMGRYVADQERQISALRSERALESVMMPYRAAMQRRGEMLGAIRAPYEMLPGAVGGLVHSAPTPVVTEGGMSPLGGMLGLIGMGAGGPIGSAIGGAIGGLLPGSGGK